MATWNSLDISSNLDISNNFLTISNSGRFFGGNVRSGRATESHSTGKHYFELTLNSWTGSISTSAPTVGLSRSNYPLDGYWLGETATGWGLEIDGWAANNNVWNEYPSLVFDTNDVVGIALDCDSGKLWFAVNNVWQGNPSAGTGALFSNVSGDVFPTVMYYNYNTDTITGHFLPNDLNYLPPSGFNAWTLSAPTALSSDTQISIQLAGQLFDFNDDRTLSQKILDHLLRTDAWLKFSSVYVALYINDDPLTEVSAIGYSRKSVLMQDASWSLTNGVLTNTKAIQFPFFSSTIVGWSLMDRLIGGYVLLYKTLESPIVVSNTQPGPYFPPGQLSVTVL